MVMLFTYLLTCFGGNGELDGMLITIIAEMITGPIVHCVMMLDTPELIIINVSE